MKYTSPPSHYYFFSSQKSRYLKGLLLSSIYVLDSKIENVLFEFIKECPLIDDEPSQAPLGLYLIDLCEVLRWNKNELDRIIKKVENVISDVKKKEFLIERLKNG